MKEDSVTLTADVYLQYIKYALKNEKDDRAYGMISLVLISLFSYCAYGSS